MAVPSACPIAEAPPADPDRRTAADGAAPCLTTREDGGVRANPQGERGQRGESESGRAAAACAARSARPAEPFRARAASAGRRTLRRSASGRRAAAAPRGGRQQDRGPASRAAAPTSRRGTAARRRDRRRVDAARVTKATARSANSRRLLMTPLGPEDPAHDVDGPPPLLRLASELLVGRRASGCRTWRAGCCPRRPHLAAIQPFCSSRSRAG